MTRLQALLSLLKRPAARIALAIALSLLIHAALLLGPDPIRLAAITPPPPPLVARLEPLPAIRIAPEPKPAHKTRIAHKPRVNPVITSSKPAPVTPPVQTPPAESAQTPPVETSTAEASSVAAAPLQTSEMSEENAQPAYPLPKHAQLTFIAYMGNGFIIGEARQRLDINDDKSYTLQTGVNTTGIAGLFKTFELNQQSTGTITSHGIRPDKFSENKRTSRENQTLSATFDWQNKQISFSGGNSSPLPDGAQDLLSFLYQFSQMPLDQARLPMHVSNGKKLESYELEVGEEEEIQTRLGRLRVLPLRKVHAPGEEGLEIWLGLEYRLLPVKIRQIDKNGKIAGEMVISDIRVSDE